MNNKKELGQFYSTNFELIEKHSHWIKQNDFLIDPFAGQKDLLNFFKNQHIAYDLEPQMKDIIKNDSLLNPPDFNEKFLITNPPFLNINKTKNKSIFNLYKTDDLYKASLLSFIGKVEKGIIILPSAFWFNERSQKIREDFLSVYEVPYVSVFNKTMFEDTTYTVCSFYFQKITNKIDKTTFEFFGKNNGIIDLYFSKENNYSILQDIEKTLNKYKKKVKITRYTDSTAIKPTNIFLNCIDTTEKIKAEIKEPFCGIKTDRAFLTFVLENETLTEEEEKIFVENFNTKLNFLRDVYMDSFLSNYRNDGRKRISFQFAYKLFEDILTQIKKEKTNV